MAAAVALFHLNKGFQIFKDGQPVRYPKNIESDDSIKRVAQWCAHTSTVLAHKLQHLIVEVLNQTECDFEDA